MLLKKRGVAPSRIALSGRYEREGKDVVGVALYAALCMVCLMLVSQCERDTPGIPGSSVSCQGLPTTHILPSRCPLSGHFIKQAVPAFQSQGKRCLSFKIMPLDTLFQIVFRPARYNHHSDINILIGIDL